jgi:hypothetical protein
MSARKPVAGEYVLCGDGRWSEITYVHGPTLPGFGANDGTHAVCVKARGDRILYVDPMVGGAWAAGGEDFQDRDPYRAAIARAVRGSEPGDDAGRA